MALTMLVKHFTTLQKHSWCHRLMDSSVTKDKMIMQDGLDRLLAKVNSGIFCIFIPWKFKIYPAQI